MKRFRPSPVLVRSALLLLLGALYSTGCSDSGGSRELQLEQLQHTTVRGLTSEPVALVAGQTAAMNDPPFQDVEAALTAITVTPGNPSIAKGTTQQFVATGPFSDGTQRDLSTSAVRASGSAGVATVSRPAPENPGAHHVSPTFAGEHCPGISRCPVQGRPTAETCARAEGRTDRRRRRCQV